MSEETRQPAPRRVLSGMRPTGRLHLGNYMGALYNWVKLQREALADGTPKYECYFFIADFHALTTDYADTSSLKENVRQVALDFLAAGLDPKRCTIFVQSKVPAHAELGLLLGMITPLSWLERVPSYKDQQEQLKEKDLGTFGFLGYPLLMSADILVYQADFVPVGQDQAAHVEITREIARRFNFLYPQNRNLYSPSTILKGDSSREFPLFEISRSEIQTGSTRGAAIQFDQSGAIRKQVDNPKQSIDAVGVLPEPKVLLTPSPKLPGTDGRKMSKSYGNTILLSDSELEVRAKLKTMVTDPARIRRTDAGNPEVCPVFDLHKVFSSNETQTDVRAGCTTAGIGCIQCKGWLADAVVAELAPIQKRREYFEAHPGEVDAILNEGAVRANRRAEQTMQQVRCAVGLV